MYKRGIEELEKGIAVEITGTGEYGLFYRLQVCFCLAQSIKSAAEDKNSIVIVGGVCLEKIARIVAATVSTGHICTD